MFSWIKGLFLSAILFSSPVIENRYLHEINVLCKYSHAWVDASYQEQVIYYVYYDDRPPYEYSCVLGKGATEGEAWENADYNIKKKRVHCYRYGPF